MAHICSFCQAFIADLIRLEFHNELMKAASLKDPVFDGEVQGFYIGDLAILNSWFGSLLRTSTCTFKKILGYAC